jgi:hypothetical protein
MTRRLKPAYKPDSGRSLRQHNKTLYLRPEDVELWDRAARLIPYHLDMSVSEFCTDKIREVVKKLEAK